MSSATVDNGIELSADIDDHMFDHLERMSDDRGLFEHAEFASPRLEHGHCTDDNARMLIVTSRSTDTGPAHLLSRLALDFVLAAQSIDGRSRNRMDSNGKWTDRLTTEDCWGRSVWAFGHAAAHHDDPTIRQRALRGFDVALRERPRHSRSMAFAVLGAVEVIGIDQAHPRARAVLIDMATNTAPAHSDSWQWPEPRLTYANAALAEATLATGVALGDSTLTEQGLAMLTWLLERETRDGHLSVTAVGGSGPDDDYAIHPHFDQQPIEVAAMADACWRAFCLTSDHRWSRAVDRCAAWFTGANDVGLAMFDAATSGGYDGLHRDSVNLNQGAESTIALISTRQRAQSLALCLTPTEVDGPSSDPA